jgi:two-component system, NtrC family, sensor kinase
MTRDPDKKTETSEGLHRNEALRQAQARLLGRPRVSIQFRFLAALSVCFFMCCAFAFDSLVLLDRVSGKIVRLGTLDELASRIQEARLVEFGMPGDDRNANTAQMNCYAARTLLQRELPDLAADLSQADLSGLLISLDQYRGHLDEWVSLGGVAGSVSLRRSSLATTLRAEGAGLSSAVAAMIRRERASMLRTLSLSGDSPFLLLAVMLLLFAGIAYLHARALRDPIRRFQSYAARIAQADFALIPPARSYRDEFTDLAVAVNQMLADLQASQESCLRSAKLAAVGTITSGIAHELSNPLNNISLTTETLLEDFKTMTAQRQWALLQDIFFETERASEIVKSLLDFTRREKPEMVTLDLGGIIESTQRLLQNEMALNDVQFVCDLPHGLPPITGAANQLRQVFLNLFINAIQAMPRGGKLTVTGMPHNEDRVCLEVHDEGTGIPPEALPHVFDPFFTTKEPGKGTGLGLSVSLSIIKKHGGDIQVACAPGGGTAFHICLPRATET